MNPSASHVRRTAAQAIERVSRSRAPKPDLIEGRTILPYVLAGGLALALVVAAAAVHAAERGSIANLKAGWTDSGMADPHSDRGCRRRILPCSRGGHGTSSCERPGITKGTLARAISVLNAGPRHS